MNEIVDENIIVKPFFFLFMCRYTLIFERFNSLTITESRVHLLGSLPVLDKHLSENIIYCICDKCVTYSIDYRLHTPQRYKTLFIN